MSADGQMDGGRRDERDERKDRHAHFNTMARITNYNVAITTFSYRRWTGKPQSVFGDVCKSKTSYVTLSSF